MVEFISNPPDASSLMTSARSFGNYDLAGALADLIDNSIKARARNVHLFCEYHNGDPSVMILDDGHGMSREELHNAMKPASTNPLEERSPDDLGRFGWGMKSASFSQCMELTVISQKDGNVSGTVWNLEAITDWAMGVLSDDEIRERVGSIDFPANGTLVIWTKCDRLSDEYEISEDGFNSLVTYTKDQLALIFHKYLSGEVPGKKFSMTLNGQSVEPYDPFFRKHKATQPLEVEELSISNRVGKIKITPYVIPHFSKVSRVDQRKLEGEEGLIKNQGFYVYRNHRLIISGTWFRLLKFGELSQLARISIDIPNSLDDLWKITVDKSDAQLPAVLRNRLTDIVNHLRKQSARVNRSKGGKISTGKKVNVWNRYARVGEITYRINREHPLLSSLLETAAGDTKKRVESVLQTIEHGFPIETLANDVSARKNDFHQTIADHEQFQNYLEASLPEMLAHAGGSFGFLTNKLKNTEPFSSHWKIVESTLKEKGWTDG